MSVFYGIYLCIRAHILCNHHLGSSTYGKYTTALTIDNPHTCIIMKKPQLNERIEDIECCGTSTRVSICKIKYIT